MILHPWEHRQLKTRKERSVLRGRCGVGVPNIPLPGRQLRNDTTPWRRRKGLYSVLLVRKEKHRLSCILLSHGRHFKAARNYQTCAYETPSDTRWMEREQIDYYLRRKSLQDLHPTYAQVNFTYFWFEFPIVYVGTVFTVSDHQCSPVFYT